MLAAFVASAAAVVPVVLLLIALTSPPEQPFFDSVIAEYAFVAFVLVAALTFFPAVLVVAVAEWKRQRGWLYFTAAGGLIALALLALLGFMPGLDHPGSPFGPGLFISGFLVVGGFVAGIVYWLIAGRTSGELRDAWATRGIAR
jgi:hypothetical protein